MRRRTLGVVVGLLALVIASTPSNGLFHLAVIDEVGTSYGGNPAAQFIEIRMLGSFQNFVQNSVLAAFDSSGAYVGDILVVPSNVAASGAGVTWLVATTAFQTASGVTADFIMPAGILPSGGGMVCFGGGGGVSPAAPGSWSRTVFTNYVDCLAYGTYSGPSNPLIGTATTANGDGHSLQRVAQSNNNSSDFTCSDTLTPKNNAAASASLPSTTPCNPPGCPATPDGACGNAAKALFQSKEAPAGKEKLLAKFIGGPALTQTDFGNPLGGGGTAYSLCVYGGTAGALVAEYDVDRAGDTCGSAACWADLGGMPPDGKGYKYKDDALAADGIFKLQLKGGEAGKSKALVKGKGPNLPAVAAALQSATSVTVQLRGNDAPQCISAALSTIVKQDATFFKAK
ncbi:MAG: hypothetical protein SF182_30000 [Deltaproteobacteria bacterium]|nr:hypothetical protein [Deltaproteobacteria bacterium]